MMVPGTLDSLASNQETSATPVPEGIATNNGEHIIRAPVSRAPEVMLKARWTIAVDIWSLGATVSSTARN